MCVARCTPTRARSARSTPLRSMCVMRCTPTRAPACTCSTCSEPNKIKKTTHTRLYAAALSPIGSRTVELEGEVLERVLGEGDAGHCFLQAVLVPAPVVVQRSQPGAVSGQRTTGSARSAHGQYAVGTPAPHSQPGLVPPRWYHALRRDGQADFVCVAARTTLHAGLRCVRWSNQSRKGPTMVMLHGHCACHPLGAAWAVGEDVCAKVAH